MTREEAELVEYRIREEGMDYTFDGYSSWAEIKDPRFHELRAAYLKAASDLGVYVQSHLSDKDDLSDEPLTGGHCTEESCESCQ